MPVKKAAARTTAKKTARGKKQIGLTSALGPKATTMLVIVVIAGGLIAGARQQQARAKERLDAARADVVVSAEPVTTKKAGASSAPVAKRAATAAPGTPAAAVSTSGTAGAASAKPVTVIGCLERTEEGFRLKETSGAEAPKTRSWKSGFLKKASASLDVVDASRTLQLRDHVGHRVSVTGTVADREMLARSLRRVGDCKGN
jgi:hypothetical protein